MNRVEPATAPYVNSVGAWPGAGLGERKRAVNSFVLRPAMKGPSLNSFTAALALISFFWMAPAAAGSQQGRDLERLWQAFWESESPRKAEQAGRQIAESGASFEDVLRVLKAGRPYSSPVETGRLLRTRRNRDGQKHHYMLVIPQSYDPSRRYPVRFYLHGGVGRPAMKRDGSWWQRTDRAAGPGFIAAFPASWNESTWWQPSQIENLQGILDELKRVFNVDENRVCLIGVSDGGTGVFYQAFRNPTPWASFVSLIGHPAALATVATGQMHIANLRNRPFLAINGGRDPLYPVSSVTPWIELFRRAGIRIEFHPRPETGHDVRWWPEEADAIERFLAATPRNPLPDRISWETESESRFNRCHWLLITGLREVRPEDSTFEDVNTIPQPYSLGVEMEEADGEGVRLTRIADGSLGDAAGLRRRDVVVMLDDTPVRNIADLNQAVGRLELDYGSAFQLTVRRGTRQLQFRIQVPDSPHGRPAFPLKDPSGRVDLQRRGNLVEARTRGVRSYTLLISPDQFDFSQPIRVVTNGRESFNGLLVPDPAVLLSWAAKDNDRTQLFAAELPIRVE